MHFQFIDIVRSLAGSLLGGSVGYAFGLLQQAALRRHEERARVGAPPSGWSLMPGAGTRVAYLLVSLLVAQLFCPLLFQDGAQWGVSAGVLLGYGWTLFRQLRQRMKS